MNRSLSTDGSPPSSIRPFKEFEKKIKKLHKSKMGRASKCREFRSSSATIPKDIPNEFYCPITCERMKNPVVACDGFTYEKEAIEKWLKFGNYTSPMTRETILDLFLIPNRNLKNLSSYSWESLNKYKALLNENKRNKYLLQQKTEENIYLKKRTHELQLNFDELMCKYIQAKEELERSQSSKSKENICQNKYSLKNIKLLESQDGEEVIHRKKSTFYEKFKNGMINLNECLDAFRKSIFVHENKEILLEFIELLILGKHYYEAFSVIHKLKLLNANNIILKYLKVEILNKMGRKYEADKIFKKAEKKYTESCLDHQELYFKSRALLSLGNITEALCLAQKSLDIFTKNAKLMSHLIFILENAKFFTRCIKICNDVLKKNPNNLYILYKRSKCFLESNQKRRGKDDLNKIILMTTNTALKSKCMLLITEDEINEEAKLQSSQDFNLAQTPEIKIARMIKNLEEVVKLNKGSLGTKARILLVSFFCNEKRYPEAQFWLKKCSKKIEVNDDIQMLQCKAVIVQHYNMNNALAYACYSKLCRINPPKKLHYQQLMKVLL